MNNILLLVKIEYKISVDILKEMIKILFNLDLGKKIVNFYRLFIKIPICNDAKIR